MSHPTGRHFLQIPGPTNVPDRVLRAMDNPTIDHRSADFAELAKSCLEGMKAIFQTRNPVIIFPASGTGAWEAALVNTLSPGDRVLAFETGHFATLWSKMAANLGLRVDFVPGDWRHGVDPAAAAAKLSDDRNHEIKAVMVVHNETSTGVTSNVAAVRRAMDDAKHPGLLLVDTISSLASIDYRHDEWGVDVTVGGSQKGLMLPPGLSFNAVSAESHRGRQDFQTAQELLAMGRNAGEQRQRILPLHSRDEPALRPAGSVENAPGGRVGERLPPARPPGGGDAPRGTRLGPGDLGLRIPPNTAVRSRPSCCRKASANPHSGRWCWTGSICRSGRGSERSRARSFASATWAISTTSCWLVRWPASRWGSSSRVFPIGRAESTPLSIT